MAQNPHIEPTPHATREDFGEMFIKYCENTKDKIFHLEAQKDYSIYEQLLNVFKDNGKYYAVYASTYDSFKTQHIRISELNDNTKPL